MKRINCEIHKRNGSILKAIESVNPDFNCRRICENEGVAMCDKEDELRENLLYRDF